MGVYSDNHTKHINTLCGQNVKFLIVTAGGMYIYNWSKYCLCILLVSILLVFYCVQLQLLICKAFGELDLLWSSIGLFHHVGIELFSRIATALVFMCGGGGAIPGSNIRSQPCYPA
jgi:hypothetical protein